MGAIETVAVLQAATYLAGSMIVLLLVKAAYSLAALAAMAIWKLAYR